LAARGRREATGEEETDPLIGLIALCTVGFAAVILGGMAFILYKNPSVIDMITGTWNIWSGITLAMFLASPLPLLFVHWLSPWKETLWDYTYAFTAACAYNYMMPASTFTILLLAQTIVGGGIAYILNWANLITLASIVATALLTSIAMQVYSIKERRLETGANTTSPVAFVLMQATTALLAYRTMQLSGMLPIIYYLVTLPTITTYLLTWLALATYLAASKSNPLWLIAAVIASVSGIIAPSFL